MNHTKTDRGTHCWYGKDTHLYFWPGRVEKKKIRGTLRTRKSLGVSVKRRIGHKDIRHYSIAYMKYDSSEYAVGIVRFFELCYHKSNKFQKGRITGSKRYIRVKVCL